MKSYFFSAKLDDNLKKVLQDTAGKGRLKFWSNVSTVNTILIITYQKTCFYRNIG